MPLIGMGAGPQVVGILNDVLEPRFATEAVRYSLLIVVSSKIIAVTLFLLACRYLHADLKKKDRLPVSRSLA